ncbi:flavin reductase family protein [Alkalihalobacillus pseudalcaliphilus]|uniref:flavin reductase family protein n=1 Tax=Alkalihalobacillus pseudalcaliphilus TaxID=79884 RepID=UPI00064DD86A|nr:flavin reductase family protein [Alkalihalobacillus pseudalcaliphilus]KMK78159.1 hypothetical protein AB990_01600 [Alkalihalobacillus pseudalcaliphilus]
MQSIDPSTLTEKEKYKFLIGSVIPRPIAFITTLAEDGTLNAAPFSYFNIVSAEPARLSVAINRKKGQTKDTAAHILSKKEFVIHIVDSTNVEKVNLTAEALPRNQSEVEKVGLAAIPSVKISVPALLEAKVRFECVLEHHLPLEGETGEIGTDLIIGKVVHFHIQDDLYENGRIDRVKLDAVGRLAGNDYTHVNNQFTLKRP